MPVCPVSQWERAVLAQWFAGTDRIGPDAISAAYVSERSRDEPQVRNKIVISERDRHDMAYLIHRPAGELAWVLVCARTNAELGRFRTLPGELQCSGKPRKAGANNYHVRADIAL